MKRAAKNGIGVVVLLLGAVCFGCDPAKPAAAPVLVAARETADAHPVEAPPVIPPPPPECPTGTAWQGDQCVIVEPVEPATKPPVQESSVEPAVGSVVATSTFETRNGALVLPGPVVFDTGKDSIKAASNAVLEHVRSYLVAKPEITLLRIEGHTSSDGSAVFNQALTERRALSVAKWLVGRGISCKRLIAVGFGATKPVAPNSSASGKEQNRRMVFANAALKGKPIGGMPVDGGGKAAGDPCK